MVRVVFLHPDLGIGGAERLVIDAALAMKLHDHDVQFITSHHDPAHCFPETNDGTLPVVSVGDWIPRNVLGRFYALFAYVRMIYAAFYLIFFDNFNPDVIFCDQISACIPVLKFCQLWKKKVPVLFYCHFPDQLLTRHDSLLKSVYRYPLDWLEEWSTGKADSVLVNSRFTGSVFSCTFRSLALTPRVLYPSTNMAADDQTSNLALSDVIKMKVSETATIFLSINRYERKKNLTLAIDAFAKLHMEMPDHELLLVMAGGYDDRVTENIDHHAELVKRSQDLHIADHVLFLKSPSDEHKQVLLENCTCVLYTPDREHFGIVPLEAMYSGKPVIAVNSGGPKETVVDGETGYLCEQTPESFAGAMKKFTLEKQLSGKLGQAGKNRVQEKFSFNAFSENLVKFVLELVETKKQQ